MHLRRLLVLFAGSVIACGTPTAPAASPAPTGGQAASAAPSASAAASPNAFTLTLDQLKAQSQSMNFEILGHSYFPGPHLASGSFGAGFNTPRVYKGIAYLAGYPPTLFGVIIADVKDPANMKQLAFIPNNPGTRTAYLRLNAQKNILVIGYDANAANPIQVPAGQSVKGGWVFYDVKDPANPVKLGEFVNPGAATHGFEIDDRYVYGCASTTQTKKPVGTAQSLSVVDYSDPKNPTLASIFHITGQFEGETYASDDVKNPDGTPQIIQCHEVNKDGTRLWVAWRDAGILSLDASDPKNVKQLGRYDYVPPYNGGSLGAAHTAAVSPHASGNASILLTNDEIFACPAGLDRVVDVTDPAHMTVLSTIRIPEVDDKYDAASGKFVCPPGQQSAHQPYFPPYGNGSLVFQAWYGQGMRAWDISNPYQPKEVGRFISPQYLRAPTPNTSPYADSALDRHTREVFVDPDTNLVYVTDGNGGGLTVLKYTGPIPERAPIPGVR